MLKDIIEDLIKEVENEEGITLGEDILPHIRKTAQIVAREVLRLAKEKIGEVPTGWLENEDDFTRGMAYRWRDILKHLQSLEEELTK
jgi:hypothetical protein